jgi:hypothetical protein
MKKQILFALLVAVFTGLVGVGCEALLTETPAPSNPLVGIFGVQTNEPNLVAYLEAADKLNTAVNVTATEAPIHMLLAGASTIAAAFVGWYARHKSAATDTASSVAAKLATTAPAPTPVKPV